MNRPFVIVRILGAPVVALPLILLYCALLVSWYQGRTSWLAALIATGVAYRTLSAYKRMKSYKRWLKAWQAMNTDEGTERSQENRGGSSIITTAAMLLALGVPVCVGSPSLRVVPFFGEPALVVLWCVASFYLLARLGVFMVRRFAWRRKAAPVNEPVSWLIGRASSSPNRQDVTKALPEYCARLIARGAKTPLEGLGSVRSQ